MGVLRLGAIPKVGAALNKPQPQEGPCVSPSSPTPGWLGAPKPCRVTPTAGIRFILQQVRTFTRGAEFSHTG